MIRLIYNLCSAIMDPIHTGRAIASIPRYVIDLVRYQRLCGGKVRVRDLLPKLTDRTTTTSFDSHYFYMSGWAMRRILSSRAGAHWDVGSLSMFVNLLSSCVPTTFVDIRPLEANLSGLTCEAGSLLKLKWPDKSIPSLSCLHVAEHVGLGRYGDPLNADGTEIAARELGRVLAINGLLYFALPVGKERTCYNAHRICRPTTVQSWFSDLELIEFSYVGDDGRFYEYGAPSECENSRYAAGLFIFKRPA